MAMFTRIKFSLAVCTAGIAVLLIFLSVVILPEEDNVTTAVSEQKVEGTETAAPEQHPDEKASKQEPLREIIAEIIDGESVDLSNISNPPTVEAEYIIDLVKMKENSFYIKAAAHIVNTSEETWKDIAFYFVPNSLSENHRPDFMEDWAEFEFKSISSEGKEVKYSLADNKLLLQLEGDLLPDDQKEIVFEYSLSLPEKGVRLSKDGNNYYLAQWYPMLATYNDGWNIEDFNTTGESYHTGYFNYTINYQLDQPYIVASSGLDGAVKATTKGSIRGQYIKDFYLALLDESSWNSKADTVNDTEIRVMLPVSSNYDVDIFLKEAAEAFRYFEEKIGDNPNKQLDLIANNGAMEYSNIVEVLSYKDESIHTEHTIVHEIGHQWFYFLVSNDPYHEPWLDESITQFISSLYLTEQFGEVLGFYAPRRLSSGMNRPLEKVNVPISEFDMNYGPTLYGIVPLLLKEFYDSNGGQEEALAFLSSYYKDNQYKVVTTKTFEELFLKTYGEGQREFLESWLELE